ncbi:MAG: bifunctional phosphoribosyl-AMP cyclohydrolase/phosphoribosyl-ATP diphosphatase HisIE [Thermoanaerobaculia bacterium]
MRDKSSLELFDRSSVRYDASGLVPVVAQDAWSGRVLMLAWANAEAVERTLATGEAHFWSRSRQTLWRKGETSGNVLRVLGVERDCDGDSLLLRVQPAGPACHTGATSCFDDTAGCGGGLDLGALERIVRERAQSDPETSYTARLLHEGIERMAQKVGEEATEVVIAAMSAAAATAAALAATAAVVDRKEEKLGKGKAEMDRRPSDASAAGVVLPASPAPSAQARQRLVEEASDLLFHLTVLLSASGVTTCDLAAELSARHQRRTQGTGDGSTPLLEAGASVPTAGAERSEPGMSAQLEREEP